MYDYINHIGYNDTDSLIYTGGGGGEGGGGGGVVVSGKTGWLVIFYFEKQLVPFSSWGDILLNF